MSFHWWRPVFNVKHRTEQITSESFFKPGTDTKCESGMLGQAREISLAAAGLDFIHRDLPAFRSRGATEFMAKLCLVWHLFGEAIRIPGPSPT